MPFDVRPLHDLDDARALADLVYTTYGLTYHRGLLYDPPRVVELNRTGAIGSMIAVEHGTHRVVGHLATIRPWFEIADALPAGRGPTTVEVGLSIVDPAWRDQQVQSTLALATVFHTSEKNPDLRGFYMKCVTTHPWSQRSARRFTGRATALFPAGVPAWVRGDPLANQSPTTTLLLHCPYGEARPRAIHFPDAHLTLARQTFELLGLPRQFLPARQAEGFGPGRIATWFDAQRRQGVVWVREPGASLVADVLERVSWLLGGHMEHVTVLLPLSAQTAAASPALEEAGLFYGGFIPDLEGEDTLVLERVEAREDRSRVVVVGEEAEALLDHVWTGWERSRTIAVPHHPAAPQSFQEAS